MAITVHLSTAKVYAASSTDIETYTLEYALGFEDPLHPGVYRDVLFDSTVFSFSDTCPFGELMPTLNAVLDAIANDVYIHFLQYPTYIVFEGETYAYPRLEATISVSGVLTGKNPMLTASVPMSAGLLLKTPTLGASIPMSAEVSYTGP